MSEVKSIPISNKVKIGTSCVVCGEFVELNEWEVRHAGFRLCDKCIDAIRWAKIQMKSANMNVIDLLNEVDKKIENKEDDGK